MQRDGTLWLMQVDNGKRVRMRLNKGYAPEKRRPKRIKKKLAKRYGWATCRVPPWVVTDHESRDIGLAAAEA